MTQPTAVPPSHSEKGQTFRIAVMPRQTETTEASIPHTPLVEAAQQLSINTLNSTSQGRLFFLQGQLTLPQVQQLTQHLLADPVTETYTINTLNASPTTLHPLPPPETHTIEVTLLPGVTDPVAENLLRVAPLYHIKGLKQVATGQIYHLKGPLQDNELHRLATEVLSNPVIQQTSLNQPISPPFVPPQKSDNTVETISLTQADDNTLSHISTTRRLALNLNEMQAIKAYYRQENRQPTDLELEMIAQTWSEHCVHKTFKAAINYTGPKPGPNPYSQAIKQTIPGLLKSYIQAVTEQVSGPWIRSTFVDNAGIVAFTDAWDLAFKVETHNHPSALEPYGGANTGIGGVVRDILGVSAKPIANTNVLCFGPPNLNAKQLPQGVLHPQRIANGVVHGIEDYGNKMGIPTVNGAVLYHPGYTANPLVYCGCLGILPRNSHPTNPQADDLIVVIGGRTGRDGLRGATFSSMEMDQSTGQIAGSAVQIGHPINEKQVLEVVLRVRDEGLYNAITDCGAGGLSSAVGEMAETLGATVQLQHVPLKYPGLQPWEIWLSEAQERMVFAVPAANWQRFQEICSSQDVEAVSIGQFNNSGRVKLYYEKDLVGDIALHFLHNGIPLKQMEAVWSPPPQNTAAPVSNTLPDPTQTLLALLAHPNIRSKENIIRRYDHEVQGGTAVKPLVGVDNHGPGDATVLVPLETQHKPAQATTQLAVALSVGICPAYGELDPYAMAWAAIDEAVRNLVAVGTDPTQIALLDNFCWGNPNLPDRLGALVRCAQGCYDAALAYQAPFISGKDSLNNEYTGADGDRHAIPSTLLISALGIVPDVNKTVTMDLKQTGNLLYAIGHTNADLSGSHYQLLNPTVTTVENQSPLPPQPVVDAFSHYQALHQAIAANLVQACHDCSEGGLAVTLAEMCLAGRKGATITLANVPGANNINSPQAILFSESLSRFVLEVKADDAAAFEKLLATVPYACIGQVQTEPNLQIIGANKQALINISTIALETAWRGTSPSPTPASPPPQPSQTAPPALVTSTIAPRILILHANGTNRDRDAALACQLAGGDPHIIHINQLLNGTQNLLDYHMLVIPGGFSYGDDLGAGVLWATNLRHRLNESLHQFVEKGRPVLGICNGFQTLVKAGLLSALNPAPSDGRAITLTHNALSQFECRWVYLQPNNNSPSIFTKGLSGPIYCPVAHGEGRLAVRDKATLAAIKTHNLHALTYSNNTDLIEDSQKDNTTNTVNYPANPNGSILNIAGLCNTQGNVLGLMPHPENHIFPWQHPRWHRGESGLNGLILFKNGVNYVKR